MEIFPNKYTFVNISKLFQNLEKLKKMKKSETAPAWHKKELFDEALKIKNQIDIDDFIQKINADYLYWDKIKYIKTKHNIAPEVLWAITKISRVINAKKVTFGNYTFKYNVTDKIQKGLHEFDLNIGGNLGSQSIIPDDDKKRYLISSIMEEAIASSQIEGAVTTRKKAKDMLRKNAKPRNKSEQMIVNNFSTIKHIVSIKDEPITIEKLFEVHRLITSQTMDDPNDEGKYRDSNDINVIDVTDGEIIHTPPNFEHVPQLMEELFLFFNKNDTDKFIHPIVKGCIIHFMIGFIHPFVDGNGRTARALFYWYLLKNGYWLTEYLSISRLIVKSKAQYAQAYIYSEIDENDVTYFIDYKIKTMQLAFDELRKYIERKIHEKKQTVNFQKIKNINERQALILKWVYEEPDIMFSVKEIQIRFNISNQTARTDLSLLEEMGYLEMIDLNKKTKGYCKSEKFNTLINKEIPSKIQK